MTTVAKALDHAIDKGVNVYNDVMVSSKKNRVPDTLTFTVRKGDKSIVCTRVNGTLNHWRVGDSRPYTGRGFAIWEAVEQITKEERA